MLQMTTLTKPSQVLKFILDNEHYRAYTYMCHAVTDLWCDEGLIESSLAAKTTNLIQGELDFLGGPGHTLHSLLLTTDSEYPSDKAEGFGARVGWWKQFIAKLETNNL
jgi:hypothetical protein